MDDKDLDKMNLPYKDHHDDHNCDDDDDDEEWADEQRTDDENLQFYPIFYNYNYNYNNNNNDINSSTAITFPTLKEALEYDEQNYNFNLLHYLPSLSSTNNDNYEEDEDDFFEKTIVIINKARLFVKDMQIDNIDSNANLDIIGQKLKDYLKNEIRKDDDNEEEYEKYFKPILEDDTMIMCMDDLKDMMMNCNIQLKKDQQKNRCQSNNDDGVNSKEVIAVTIVEQESKSKSSSSSINMQTTKQLENKIEILVEQLQQAKDYITKLADTSMNNDNNNSHSHKNTQQGNQSRDNDTYYFSSYSHSSIHETMLQDVIRTTSYQNAILNNPHLFHNKIIMDIGCGTSILSLFAAKAGAKKVLAIDASDVYKQAREIVDLNGYSHIIHVVHGKVEDLIANNSLPLDDDEKVDVIISEWMGYALLYETMLPSVLVARDHFMDRNNNGTMWPNKSTMFIEGARDTRLDYWDDVYGMNMKPMKDKVIHELRKEASVEIVDKEKVVTNRVELISFDLNQCHDKDLDFKSTFELKSCHHDGNDGNDDVKLDKLVVSFDVDFELPGCNIVSFSTGCQTEPTHWKQTTLWFDPDNSPLLGSGEVLKGSFTMNRNDINQRDMDFFVSWEIGLDNGDGFKCRDKGTILSKLSS